MNCYQAKAGELAKQWYVIDATDMVVGRLAAQIAPILMGKHRPTYTPHIDTGDYVIVTNVDKVVFTGNKWQQKSYQRYSGHPGGQKDEVAWKLFERRPDRILQLAVQRMMPKNKIGRHMLAKLKLYVGEQHPHQAQAPIPMEALSGRPTPAGAIFAPKAKAKTPRTETKTPAPAETPLSAEAPGLSPETTAEAQAPLPVETPPLPAPAPAPAEAPGLSPVATAEAQAPLPLPVETPPPTSAETPSVAEPASSASESAPAPAAGTESSPGGE